MSMLQLNSKEKCHCPVIGDEEDCGCDETPADDCGCEQKKRPPSCSPCEKAVELAHEIDKNVAVI